MTATDNPLLENNPVPAFDRIRPEHFPPAFDAAFAGMQEKLAALRADSSAPTFENTVVAIENLFHDHTAIRYIFETYYEATATKEIIKIGKEYSGKLSDFKKELYQDLHIAARFNSIYGTRHAFDLDAEDRELLATVHAAFEEQGSFLGGQARARLKQIDVDLIDACTQFKENCQKGKELRAVLFTDPADLKGIDGIKTDAMAEAAKKQGREGWLFEPERSEVADLLAVAESRNFREKIFKALNALGTHESHDNEPVVAKIHALRAERAALLGYPHHAAFKTAHMMAGSLEKVESSLGDLTRALLPAFEKRVEAAQAFAAGQGGPAVFEPWDFDYWAGKYDEATIDFNAAEVAPYLELNSSMNVMFAYVEEYFGLTLTEDPSFPVYHEDVKAYAVRDAKTGEIKGYFLNDVYQRKDKEGGAWMMNAQLTYTKNGVLHVPVVTNNVNYVKPAAGQPTLLTFDNFVTQFHEMGHALHGILGNDAKYASLRGTNKTPDFIEIHSFTMEQFATDPARLKQSLRHYQTGAPIPGELVDRMMKARATSDLQSHLQIIHNSLWDLGFHKVDPADYKGTADVQARFRLGGKYDALLRPYDLTRFTHIMPDPIASYSAAYFGYMTALVYAVAAYEHLQTSPGAKERLRTFYSKGSALNGNDLFADYYGGPVPVGPILRSVGIDPDAAQKKTPAPKAPAPSFT